MPNLHSFSMIRAFGIIAMLVFAGCESTRVANKPAASSELIVGMTRVQLQDCLGEPRKIEPATEWNRMEGTRYYTVDHPPIYQTITAEMQEVPYVDPITGEMHMLKEPLMDQQRIARVEQIKVVIRHNQVIEIDRQLNENRTFSR
ncbi:MAG: hypothetical protein HOH58_00405 [Opitutaceae bacterium]|nr:hypothetical protein [Opitutaceae bacterium]